VKRLKAIIFSATLLAMPFAAQAEESVDGLLTQSKPRPNSCVPHNVAVDQLSNKFNEKVVGLGLGKNQQSVVELYVSSKGRWTILVTLTNGMSCIAAAGENWPETLEQAELAS
jgi:hypothetical protein